jgi:hypothetical protein
MLFDMKQQYNCQKNATFEENHLEKNINRNQTVPPLSPNRLPRRYNDNTKA